MAMATKAIKNVLLSFGAPSITGINANDLVAQSFVANSFPLDVTIKNQAEYNLVFPNHCHLKPVYDETGNSAVIKFDSLDALHRFASDAETLAELNKRELLVTISADVTVNEPAPLAAKKSKVEEI
ncbi:MAG: hypothetical protein RIR39_1325 [Pseudomonadota bacterium]